MIVSDDYSFWDILRVKIKTAVMQLFQMINKHVEHDAGDLVFQL